MHVTLLYFTLTELAVRNVGYGSLAVGFNPCRLNSCKGDELPRNGPHYIYGNRKDYGISTLHYNWPTSAHESQTFSTYTSAHDRTDSEHLPGIIF